jgi:hypothetical protein
VTRCLTDGSALSRHAALGGGWLRQTELHGPFRETHAPMSILGKLLGTAETTARSGARGRRTTARPARGVARPVGRRGTGRGRAVPPATSGGIGRLVEGFLRRR